MVDISTHLSVFNMLINKGGVKDGYQKYISYEFGHHFVLQSAKCIIYAHFIYAYLNLDWRYVQNVFDEVRPST